MKILFTFRWPVKQVDPNKVELELVPGLSPIIDEDWAGKQHLSEAELNEASMAVIKTLAGPKVL